MQACTLKNNSYMNFRKANNDEDGVELRGRSLASIRRARQKENRVQTQDNKQEYKPVKRDVSIPEVITIRELANSNQSMQ